MVEEDGVKEIVRVCCERFHADPLKLWEKNHDSHLTKCRHVCWYLMRKKGLHYPAIARFSSRDHSTIIHGVQNIEVMLKTHPASVKLITELERELLFKTHWWYRI